MSVYATDVDRDGDIDVLSASKNDDKIDLWTLKLTCRQYATHHRLSPPRWL